MAAGPISARIIPWDGKLGVAFQYANGKHIARPIEAHDWPIIRHLKAKQKLTYSGESIRRRAERALGLDQRDWKKSTANRALHVSLDW
jgi:hypothetical protein